MDNPFIHEWSRQVDWPACPGFKLCAALLDLVFPDGDKFRMGASPEQIPSGLGRSAIITSLDDDSLCIPATQIESS
jgi:hypothetical protein